MGGVEAKTVVWIGPFPRKPQHEPVVPAEDSRPRQEPASDWILLSACGIGDQRSVGRLEKHVTL
jgi:hypothetical protein